MLGHSDSGGITDEALEALGHRYRRVLLFDLLRETRSSGDATVHYDGIPAFEDDGDRLALYHVHLPKLESAGYVDWDVEAATVAPGPRWDDIEPLLDLVDTHLNELPPAMRGTKTDGGKTNG